MPMYAKEHAAFYSLKRYTDVGVHTNVYTFILHLYNIGYLFKASQPDFSPHRRAPLNHFDLSCVFFVCAFLSSPSLFIKMKENFM